MTSLRNVLLLGRAGIVLDDVQASLDVDDVRLQSGTGLDDVRRAMSAGPIDTVIMGAGIDLSIRVAIVEYIFNTSSATTVHMKDWDSGPEGMLPFVGAVLAGLRG